MSAVDFPHIRRKIRRTSQKVSAKDGFSTETSNNNMFSTGALPRMMFTLLYASFHAAGPFALAVRRACHSELKHCYGP